MSEPVSPQQMPSLTEYMQQGVNKETPAVEASVERIRALAEIDARVFGAVFESPASTKHYLKIANFYASSSFVPDSFRNKPGDCLIALDLAHRMGVHELLVMQNMMVVKGRPGWYTRFMIAQCNRNAGFQSSITWDKEVLGDPIPVVAELKDKKVAYNLLNIRVTAWALDRFGKRIDETVDSQMAVDERWVDNLKYRSLPERMLRYRAASGLINLYAPEVMMGLPTAEELEDHGDMGVPGGEMFPQEKPGAATATAGEVASAATAPSVSTDSFAEPGGHSLTGPHFKTLRELAAGSPAVSWGAYEELYGQAVDEMISAEGETEEVFFNRLLADLNGLKDQAVAAPDATLPAGSLFDDKPQPAKR